MSDITINISSLISELKIEVRQCDDCKHLDAHLEVSEMLKNLVLESLLEAIASVRDTSLKTSDIKSQRNKSQKERR